MKLNLILIAVSLSIIAVLGFRLNSAQNKLNDTVFELETIKQQKPREIVVYRDKIEYKYKDGKTITKYVPPEGWVKFDMSEYDKINAKYDSLSKVNIQAKLKYEELRKSDSIIAGKIVDGFSKQLKTKDELLADYINIINETDRELLDIKKQLQNSKDFIIIKNKGFTFKPELGAGYNGNFDGYFGVKLAYWNRYGLSVGSTREQFGLGVSRHLDDLIPYFKNTEVFALAGMPYKDEYGKVFIGLKMGL